jgi:hypothetical protein
LHANACASFPSCTVALHPSRAGTFDTRTLLGRRRVVEPRYVDGPSFTERLNGDPSKALKLVDSFFG